MKSEYLLILLNNTNFSFFVVIYYIGLYCNKNGEFLNDLISDEW